jgi:hypothetical protein
MQVAFCGDRERKVTFDGRDSIQYHLSGVVDTPMHANDDHEFLKNCTRFRDWFKSRESWMPFFICNRRPW